MVQIHLRPDHANKLTLLFFHQPLLLSGSIPPLHVVEENSKKRRMQGGTANIEITRPSPSFMCLEDTARHAKGKNLVVKCSWAAASHRISFIHAKKVALAAAASLFRRMALLPSLGAITKAPPIPGCQISKKRSDLSINNKMMHSIYSFDPASPTTAFPCTQ